jgi:hypothetical protein
MPTAGLALFRPMPDATCPATTLPDTLSDWNAPSCAARRSCRRAAPSRGIATRLLRRRQIRTRNGIIMFQQAITTFLPRVQDLLAACRRTLTSFADVIARAGRGRLCVQPIRTVESRRSSCQNRYRVTMSSAV